jgi:hypothetical protein
MKHPVPQQELTQSGPAAVAPERAGGTEPLAPNGNGNGRTGVLPC